MSDVGSQINYKQLLDRHGRIQIPIIQRDYAQGRPSEEEVRQDFLSAIETALTTPADDPSLPFNMDFIYGSVEGKEVTRFLPLDGQQRLTTLFLLHWYLAWTDRQWDQFSRIFKAGGKSRFSYAVRTSSNEFFDALVAFFPENSPNEVLKLSALISDQPWYFRSWRLDPTIQSVLSMLDAIHARFASSQGLFARLASEDKPAITFQLLDLRDFGLSDDLYIKMNARGKPLTQFETFKARYERDLKAQFEGKPFEGDGGGRSIADYVSWRMDNAWADLFWGFRDRSTNQYDAAVMHAFRAVALVTRDPDSESYPEDVASLRKIQHAPTYSDFHSRNWLDESFTRALISLLDAWSGGGEGLGIQLSDAAYFDELSFFHRLVAPTRPLPSSEIVRFSGYVLFLRQFGREFESVEFQEWMRVIFNLSENTEYNRADDLRRSISGLMSLLPAARNILDHFANPDAPVVGFFLPQVEEERLKAQLIKADAGWPKVLRDAETHGYFLGQIEFLLDYCGVIAEHKKMPIPFWGEELHRSLQEVFTTYFQKSKLMFGSRGLNEIPEFRWQRALLSQGDYFLSKGPNYSYLVDSSTEPNSWKRLLRGGSANAREALKKLLDRLTPDRDLVEQLDAVIATRGVVDPWIEALIRTPSAFSYCQSKCMRFEDDVAQKVYLLRKTQMNGTHAELFTYALHKSISGDLARYSPLVPQSYVEVSGRELEPHFLVVVLSGAQSLALRIGYSSARYSACIETKSTDAPQWLVSALRSFGFDGIDHGACISVSPTDMEVRLIELARAVARGQLEH